MRLELKLFFVSIICMMNCFALADNLSSSEINSRTKLFKIYVSKWAMNTRGNMTSELLYKKLKNDGYTDIEIRDTLIQEIVQPDVEVGRKIASVTDRAAYGAMSLFPGDAEIEALVFAALDEKLYEGPLINPRGFLNQIITLYGSNELLEEYRVHMVQKYGSESLDYRYLEGILSKRPLFKRGDKNIQVYKENNSEKFNPTAANEFDLNENKSVNLHSKGKIKSSSYEDYSWILLAIYFLLLFLAIKFHRRKVILVSMIGLTTLTFIFCIISHNPGNNSRDFIDESVGSDNRRKATDRISKIPRPAWHPAQVEPPEYFNSPDTVDELLRVKIQTLMSPFFIADPHDRLGNHKERENAAKQLLDMLKLGMPEGFKEENWPSIVQQIIEVQSLSTTTKDNTINLIESWIGSPARTERETLAALSTMMDWEQTTPFKRGTPEFQRYERIMDLQVTFFEKASKELRPQILWNLAQAERIVREPKSLTPTKLIEDNRLLGMIDLLLQEDQMARGQALRVISSRLKSVTSSYDLYEDRFKMLVSDESVDMTARMNALEVLTGRVSFSGELPEWSTDQKISQKIHQMRAAAEPRGADGNPNGKEPANIDLMALPIIKNRITRDAELSRKVYGNTLIEIAGAPYNDRITKMYAIDLITKSNVLDTTQIKERFADDPLIGDEIQKRFAE
jgi:hypothetical protein